MNRPTRGEAVCVLGALPLPRSLTRCARSFGCGEAVSTHSKAVIRLSTESGDNAGKNMQNALRPARETSDMTDAASLADRVREGDLRLHELEAHADADTAAEARRLLVESQSGASLDAVGNYRLPRGGRRVRHREHGRLDPGADGRRRPRQRRRRLRRRRSTSPRDHRGRAPRVGQPRLLGHQQRRRLTANVLKSGMTRAPVFRVADVAEAEALVSWTRDNFAALKEAAEDDEPRRTPRRDAVRRRQLGVPAIPLRHQGRDGDEHGHHRHRGRLRRRRSRDSRLARRPLGQPLFRQSPPPSTPSRGAAGASPPTFESRARSSKNACTPRPKRSRNSTHARTWSAPRGREPRVQRPRRQRRRRDVPRHRAGRGAGRRGRERHHDRRGAGRRPLRLGLHRLPRSRHRRRRHETPTQSGASISSASAAAATPPAPTPTPSPDASPSVPSRANSPFSPRSPRGTSPAPTPNSVGNCMGVVVRPRFIGSEFVDPTLIMNVLSREIPRDYEIPRYNAYHEHITKG